MDDSHKHDVGQKASHKKTAWSIILYIYISISLISKSIFLGTQACILKLSENQGNYKHKIQDSIPQECRVCEDKGNTGEF